MDFMKLYTEAAICRVLGLTKSELQAYVKAGLIKQGRTENGLFLLEPTAREIIAAARSEEAKPPDYAAERARLMRAKRKSEEYELRVKEGQLHRTEDIERELSLAFVRFRARIQAIPSRAAAQCAKTNDEAAVFALLKGMTDEALEELGSGKFLDGDGSDGAEGDG